MKNKKYLSLLTGLAIIGAGLIIGLLSAPRPSQAALLCLPPTPLAPTVNKLTGEVTLWWQPQMAVINYTIEVYSGSSLTPIKSYTVDGKTNTWVIPDADLACGNYQYRVKAECCDERCDSCASQFDPKKDYCSNMASLWQTPCGCTDPNYPTAVQYSFYSICSGGSLRGYFCDDGDKPTGGACADQSDPKFRDCPLGDKIMGCNWECSPTTHYEPKPCGSDYEVACGQGPNKQLVSGTPSYNLCSIKDPIGWQFNDNYLIDPPGVSEELPPLLYQWKCGAGVKISEQCLACRRAECGPPQGKSFQSELPTGQLCLDSAGQPTGELANLTSTDEGWIWDCLGRTDCDTATQTNKNWVYVWNGETENPTPNTWEQLDKCWATKASCGQANGEFYTGSNFKNKETTKDFLCRGGKAVGLFSLGQLYDEYTLLAEKDFNKTILHKMLWKCVYNQGTPEEASIPCEAHIVGCRSDITGNDYTQGSFDSLTSAVPAPANLCYNGQDDRANDSQVTLGGPTDRLTPPGWEWTCSDTHGGTDNCQANLVDCKKPPHEGEYKDEQEVMAQAPLCTAGESMDFIETATGWTWNCLDDIGGQEICQANLLKCAAPPSGGVYDNWKDMEDKTGADCPGTTNTRSCTGVCSNRNLAVSVTLANGKWLWTCGSDSCSAQELACQEPPDKGAYADWDDFINNGGAKCAGTDERVRGCDHVCNDPSEWVPDVTYNPDTSQFNWTCGATHACESKPLGCGQLVGPESPLLYTDFDKYKTSPDPHSLCLSGGEAVYYKDYQSNSKYEDGFTPWGVGEWSAGAVFGDYGVPQYKEGSWLWQCKYGEKVIPSRAGQFVYEKNGTFYCYAYEKAICGDVLQYKESNKNRFTLDQIKAMTADTPEIRGNNSQPPLCDRGIVYKGTDIDGKPLDSGFYCYGGAVGSNLPQDHCDYACENGMLKGRVGCSNIDVTGCANPPYGIDYLDETAFTNVFKDWATEEGTDGCEKFNDGRTLASTDRVWNPDTCQWTWKCGGMGCYANKTKAALTATIVPATLPDVCATDETARALTAVTNCVDIADITWKASVDGGPVQIVGNGKTFNFTAKSLYESLNKVAGLYSISYHIICRDTCLEGVKEADAKPPVTLTINSDKPQDSSLTANKNTICAGDNVNLTAVNKDPDCKNPTFEWTNSDRPNCDLNSPLNTCQNQYNIPGTYNVGVTIKCGACFQDWTRSQQITVKDKPTLNDILGKTDFCSKTPESYTTTANNCDAGTITWALTDKNGKTIGEIDDVKNANYTPPSDLDSGDYNLTATLNCTDPCAATDLKSKVIIIEASPTAEVGVITVVPPSPICSDVAYKLILSRAECSKGDPTIEWFENGVPIPEANGSMFYNVVLGKTVNTPTDFSYTVKVTCGKDPCSDTATSTPKVVTVNPKPDFASLNGPQEFCSATPPQYTAVTTCSAGTVDFEMIDESTGLPVAGSAESVAIVNFSAGYTPKPKPLNPIDGRGTYTVRATMHCTDPCEATKTLEVKKVEVYSCVCGSANDKFFVGGDNNTLSLSDINPPFVFCKPGCSVEPDTPLSLKGDGWTWECKCGTLPLVTGCEAKQTKCGPASSEANGADRYYVDDSWNDPTARGPLCTNAFSTNPNNPLAIDTGTDDEAGTASTDCNGRIKDTWQWQCADSVGGEGHELDCSAKRLDCGIADAQRVLDNGCAIQPYDATDGYRGSYNKDVKDGRPAGVPVEHQCNWGGSFTDGYEDTGRGKWWWECRDSLYDPQKPLKGIVQCEARRDCDWARRDQTDTNGNVGDNSQYATVDYGTAGCWTAEDVGEWDNNNVKDMIWGRATRFKLTNNDPVPACVSPALWKDCKRGHCNPRIDSFPCNKTGVCPTGFFVPEDSEWNSLEIALGEDPDKNCVRDLTKLGPAGGYQCLPAGNDGDTMPDLPNDDGLKDKITFDGVAGVGYWTKSQKSSAPPKLDFCSSSGNCLKTLPYYELNGTDEVGRAAGTNTNVSCGGDSNNYVDYIVGNNACLKQNVRCIKPFSGYGSAGGGGGEKQCYGWGCGLSQ